MANAIETKLINTIKDALTKAFPDLDVNSVNVMIEIPTVQKFGDYSSNIAMQLTRILRQNPRNLANLIIENLDYAAGDIDRVEIAGAGFINFFLKKGSLGSIIQNILSSDENYGKGTYGNGKSYDVEFVSANPTGDLHLGHARQAALGDSICRLLEAVGFDVEREYYINDAGNQIHNLALSLKARYNQIFNPDYKMPEDGYFGPDVINIAKGLAQEVNDKYVNKDDEETYTFFRTYGVKKELEKLQKDLLDFRVNFTMWSSETEIRKQGFVEKAVETLKEKGYLYENEGAVWFRTTDFGDDKDRVIVKTDGSYTYLTPDIAYHIQKLSRGYDFLVDLLGADHHGYIARMKAAIQALGHEPNKLEIELVQMVRLIKDGQEMKMSKRTGNAVTIRELCEEVGTDAVRYYFVARSASSHLDFDLDLASSTSSENPVYYAQYAHARTCQILELAKKNELVNDPSCAHLEHQKEIDLMKFLATFPDVVLDAALTFTPSKITNYTQKLAQLFHAFYNECKVIDLANVQLSQERLALVNATRITMRNALNLVGVNAPNKM